MAILAPENGTRKLLPPDATLVQLTPAQVLARAQANMRQSRAASWARAAAQQALRFGPGLGGASAGGAIKPTFQPPPVAIPKPPPMVPPKPPVAKPPPPPQMPKVPKLPPLPPLPPPPTRPPGGAAGGGGSRAPVATPAVGARATPAFGGGILLLIGMVLLASFGKRL